MVLIGVAVGVVGALVATRALSGLLFGIGSLDPVALGGAAAALAVLASSAALLPALRAAKIEPGKILRNE